jgi:hypothetical protein
LQSEVTSLAARLTGLRSAAAERFASEVTAELTALAMPHASLTAVVSELDAPGPYGADDVEIRLAAHPGAPALPLNKGASGGELSRVMLAIEVVFAGADPVPTFVFDEVDAGVGGKAAGRGVRRQPPGGGEVGRRAGDRERRGPAGPVRPDPRALPDAGRPGGIRVRPGARGGTAGPGGR